MEEGTGIEGSTDQITLVQLLVSYMFYVLFYLLIFAIKGRSIAFRGERGNDESPIEMIKVSHLK